MIFMSPVWFWLGLGVLIPVFIHLWNKKAGQPRLLGTYRFLPEESRAAASRIELHDIPLLLIRIGIVVLVMLLLTNWLWPKEPEPLSSLIIQEVNADHRSWKEDDSGKPLLQIPAREIDEHGWWNIIQQVEQARSPQSIGIQGNLTQNRFMGKRPSSGALIDWHQVDSLETDKKQLATWTGYDGKFKALIQYRTEFGIRVEINDLDENADEVTEPVLLLINSANTRSINEGLKYVAEMYKINVIEQEMSDIARVQSGDSMHSAIHIVDEDGISELAEANPYTGISFHVTGMDTLHMFSESLILSKSGHTILGFGPEGDLVMNGVADPEFQSWVYAAAGNALILNSLGIELLLYPRMDESQMALSMSEGSVTITSELRSANNWIFILLIFFWIAERMWAPKRGM